MKRNSESQIAEAVPINCRGVLSTSHLRQKIAKKSVPKRKSITLKRSKEEKKNTKIAFLEMMKTKNC